MQIYWCKSVSEDQTACRVCLVSGTTFSSCATQSFPKSLLRGLAFYKVSSSPDQWLVYVAANAPAVKKWYACEVSLVSGAPTIGTCSEVSTGLTTSPMDIKIVGSTAYLNGYTAITARGPPLVPTYNYDYFYTCSISSDGLTFSCDSGYQLYYNSFGFDISASTLYAAKDMAALRGCALPLGTGTGCDQIIADKAMGVTIDGSIAYIATENVVSGTFVPGKIIACDIDPSFSTVLDNCIENTDHDTTMLLDGGAQAIAISGSMAYITTSVVIACGINPSDRKSLTTCTEVDSQLDAWGIEIAEL